MLGIARSLSARKEWSEQRFQSIKTGTTNGLEECDHFHLLGENSRLPRGRQASELLAVPVGRSPARIAPTGRISAFPFSDVFLSQVVVSLHLFGSYYLIKRPDNYIILGIHGSPQPFRRPEHAANRPENRSVASDPRYPDQPGRADLFGQVCGGHRDPDLAAEQVCQDQEERQRSIGG